jgi:hypothetical protein
MQTARGAGKGMVVVYVCNNSPTQSQSIYEGNWAEEKKRIYNLVYLKFPITRPVVRTNQAKQGQR